MRCVVGILSFCMLLLYCCSVSSQAAEGDAGARAIFARMDRAEQAHRAREEQLLPLERNLLLLANFEQDNAVLFGHGGFLPVPLDPRHYCEGKFGRGYWCEAPRYNLLPPATAKVETDLSGFTVTGGAQMRSAETDTPFGQRSLSVTLPHEQARLTTVPVPCAFHLQAGHEKTVTLIASCYLKGPKGRQVILAVNFIPLTPAKAANTDEQDEPGNKDVPESPAAATAGMADSSVPQTITLTGEWQRAACYVTADKAVPERKAVLTLSPVGAEALELLADGFQFEQGDYYPLNYKAPTSWVPGGQSAPATTFALSLREVQRAFPTREGTISFWTRIIRTSNLKPGCGGWVDFSGSDQGRWSVDTYITSAGMTVDPGGKAKPFYAGNALGSALDGQWHHIALTWDAAQGSLYVDGTLRDTFMSRGSDLTALIDNYRLTIGGNGHRQVANAAMDELAVFNRKLTGAEVTTLADGKAPLRITTDRYMIAAGIRSTFYRDEQHANLDFQLRGQDAAAPVTVDCAVGDARAFSAMATIAHGQGTVTFPFAPAQLKCGVYRCRVSVSTADGAVGYQEFPITVVPALRRDLYLISTWGSYGSGEWMNFYHTLGLNMLDVNTPEAQTVDTLGQQGFFFNWHCDIDREGDYSPARRETLKAEVDTLARRYAPFPNWHGVLLNTETGPGDNLPEAETRAAWFDAEAERELGTKIPASGWRFGSPNNPIYCKFPDGSKPGPDGIYTGTPDTYRVLDWWNNRGGLHWKVNALAAGVVKTARPDVVTWTDPMISAGEVAKLDAGSTWSYAVHPETIFNELQAGYDLLRGSGKAYYCTLGLNYVAGKWLTVTEPDGVKKNLMPTPDDAIQQAWVAVSIIPSAGLLYWDVDGWYDGLRGLTYPGDTAPRYCPPGSDVALGAALKQDIFPIGAMLNSVPNAQRPVALLLPESTLWFDAAEGGWGWGTYHYPNYWKGWLAKSNMPYDILYDRDITPGALAKYPVIIFPMAQFVQDTVYRELVAAANAGTTIIVDHYGKQTYPNMERWEQEYFYWLPEAKRANYGEETLKRLAALRTKLLPTLDAVAEGQEGPVLTNVREYRGVQYVAVINNNRQDGPYTTWTKNPRFQPYGKAQQATVSLRTPAGSAVYEFTTSRQLPATLRDGRLEVTVDLPPHAGRLLCVYPEPLTRVTLAPAPEYRLGVPGVIAVSVLTRSGKTAPGRQLVMARLTDPTGQPHDESGWYRLEDGKAQIPFRPALNDRPGAWRLEVTEHSSGLAANGTITVQP